MSIGDRKMHLTQVEIEEFYKLWYGLVWGVNEKQKVIPHFSKPVYGTRVTVSQEDFMKIRDEMWKNPKWIDNFLKQSDNGEFTEKQRGTILSWSKNFVNGQFVIMRHLKNYSVFMQIAENEPVKLYGVNGISDTFKDTCHGGTHVMVEVVLIPFGDKIIYDTFLVTNHISFGSGTQKIFNNEYKVSKDKHGIITSLNK